MSTTKLNIGKIPISKGEYQEGTTYQRLNQVTMLGSTYQSKIDDNTSAPAQMGADGAVENINTDKWLCIAVGNVSAARKVVYNNETSGLEAGNVQEAIDKLSNKKFDKESVVQESGDAEDKVMSQKVVTDNFTELQNMVFPLQVSLSLNKTLLEYTGTEQTIKASYSIKRKDAAITPTSLTLSVNGTMQEIDIKASDTISIEVNKEGESTVVLTAKLDDLVKSATAKVVMVLPIYFGFGTSEADVVIAGNKLGPSTSATGMYEKTSTMDRVNFIILVPKTLPKLSSFTMGGAPFVMITTSVVINGKDYYMYKSGGVYMSGTTVRVQAS